MLARLLHNRSTDLRPSPGTEFWITLLSIPPHRACAHTGPVFQGCGVWGGQRLTSERINGGHNRRVAGRSQGSVSIVLGINHYESIDSIGLHCGHCPRHDLGACKPPETWVRWGLTHRQSRIFYGRIHLRLYLSLCIGVLELLQLDLA